MSDRSWMYRRLKDGYINLEFVDGVNKFIDFAFLQVEFGGTIRCPCSMCKNKKFQIKEEVTKHLLQKGFVPFYSSWIFHGEVEVDESTLSQSQASDLYDENPYRDMVLDAMGVDHNMEDQPPNLEAQKFLNTLEAADEPLWDGCKKKTKLSACAKLMALKSRRGLTEETYLRKKAELEEDASEWNPTLWVEASGGLTRGRVYGAPYVDANSLLNKGSKSSTDNISYSKDSAISGVSTSMILTPQIKKLIEKEVQLTITSKYGSATPSQPLQPSQLQESPQQFSFPQPTANQQPGQFPQPSFQFVQPSVPYHQTLGSFQSIPVSCQQTFGNFTQQFGPFTQLLGPITEEYNPQSEPYQAAAHHHGTFHQSLNDDNIE